MSFTPSNGPPMSFSPSSGPSVSFTPSTGPCMSFTPSSGPPTGSTAVDPQLSRIRCQPEAQDEPESEELRVRPRQSNSSDNLVQLKPVSRTSCQEYTYSCSSDGVPEMCPGVGTTPHTAVTTTPMKGTFQEPIQLQTSCEPGEGRFRYETTSQPPIQEVASEEAGANSERRPRAWDGSWQWPCVRARTSHS